MSNKRKELMLAATAYHEAGHAVACRLMGAKVKSATIVPKKGEYDGRVVHESMFRGLKPDIELTGRARLQIERSIIICLAGAAAQRRYNRKSWRSCHGGSDFHWVVKIVTYVCEGEAEINAFIRWLEIRTDSLIATYWDAVQRVAEALLKHKTLPGDEVVALIDEARGVSREQQQAFREIGMRLAAAAQAAKEEAQTAKH